MKIGTWNIERLKHRKHLLKMRDVIEEMESDILVLTENDERINPKYSYSFHTPKLHEAPFDYRLPGRYKDFSLCDAYAATENRVSIYTNYSCVKQYETYDKYTSLCVELETEVGNLIVYGTIIGVIGCKDKSFERDLLLQTEDYERLSKMGSICICGDYNCSFADNYYFTYFGRDTLSASFAQNKISLLTRNQPDCIDHIAVSQDFVDNTDISISEYNIDKSLSDHKGITVEISFHEKLRHKAVWRL